MLVPNELQRLAFPKVRSGRNILIVAPTGSGKTECAVLPLFEILEGHEGLGLIYVTPLRALNRDLLRRIERYAEEHGLTVSVRHGDTESSERRRQSLSPPNVLITTPETLQLLFLGKRLRKALKSVRFVVLDEVHELAESERGVQLLVALERLRRLTDYRMVGLSATVRNVDEVAEFFGFDEVLVWRRRKELDVRVIKVDVEEIPNIVDRSLIFVNTRQTAEALGLTLKRYMDVEVHHGSLSRSTRIEAEEKFKEGKLKALICTSSMELGIDIGHVKSVVQFGSPREVNRLVQRVGRSGHKLGEVSKGVIVASTFDDIIESWVIAERAMRGDIEETKMHEMCWDVLANQICAIAIEYGEISVKECYRIFKRLRPFRDLDYDRFVSLCEFLKDLKLIRFDGESVRITRRSRSYFYDNLSMIPDERRLKVVDVVSGKVIGYLDESFVSSCESEVFAMKGELWRIVSINNVVRVEPYDGEGIIPFWIGEEIPVPFDVAQDVGKVRGWIGDLVRVYGRREAESIVLERFKTNRRACEEVISTISEQIKRGFAIPTDVRVTIEGNAIVNACFGHRVNETLGKVLALLLHYKSGRSVEMEFDPYRIRLSAKGEDVLEVLRSIEPESLDYLVEKALKDTRAMQIRIVHCSRKFGYLSKSVDVTRLNLRRLVSRLEGTPIYDEALRELVFDRLDLERTRYVLERIREGEISISTYSEPSPIALKGRDTLSDLITPKKPTKAILELFKRRLEEEICVLMCMNCGCTLRSKVKFIDDLECPKCKSKLVACVNSRRRLEELDKKELFRIANLVMCYGKKAILALNTYGVGVETASRILAKPYRSEDEFLMELLEAEKRFIRTRRFWE